MSELNQPTEEHSTMMLPCRLGDTELIEHAKEQSKLLHEIEELRSEKKATAANFNLDIKDKEQSLKYESDIVADGTMEAEIDVTTKYFWELNEYTIVRDDTGELVEKETIPEYKRQGEMELE